jgi:hypothetical protein
LEARGLHVAGSCSSPADAHRYVVPPDIAIGPDTQTAEQSLPRLATGGLYSFGEHLGQQLGPREHRVVPGQQLHHAIRLPRVAALCVRRRRPVLGAHDVGRGLLPPRDSARLCAKAAKGWRVRRLSASVTVSSSQSCMNAAGASSAFMLIVPSSSRGSIHGPSPDPRSSPASRHARASPRSRRRGA